MTDSELSEKIAAIEKKSNWRQQLRFTATGAGGGAAIGWGIAMTLAPAYVVIWMIGTTVVGLFGAVNYMEAGDHYFNVERDREARPFQEERVKREKLRKQNADEALKEALEEEKRQNAQRMRASIAGIKIPGAPGAGAEDFNSNAIRVMKPMTFRKPSATFSP